MVVPGDWVRRLDKKDIHVRCFVWERGVEESRIGDLSACNREEEEEEEEDDDEFPTHPDSRGTRESTILGLQGSARGL